jgi:uncharacterized protein (TIGR02145 family)
MKGLLKPLCVVSLLFTAAGAQASKAVVTQVGGAFKVIPIFTCPEPTQPAEVVSATGRIWLDRNLGAVRAAESVNDRCAYGDLYQWGRLTDGHEKRNSGTTTTISSGDVPGHGLFIIGSSHWRLTDNDNLWQGVSGISNPCPSGFRLPTEAEIIAEISSWSSQNAAGAFASPLKLVTAGARDHRNGSIGNESEGVRFGAYWSSTVDGEDVRALVIDDNSYHFTSASRGYGVSVRCIKN